MPTTFRSLPAAVLCALGLAGASAAASPAGEIQMGDRTELALERAAPAQHARTPDPIQVLSLRPAADRVRYDTTAEGVVWARGASYKASFGPAGAVYVPFLGSDAPRSFPVRISLASARAGAVEVGFERSARAQRDGDTITLDRGAIREVYQLTPGSVEQSFDLDARAADGDLVVRLELETELDVARTAEGLSFSNELGRVDYTHAVAIDARGERRELEIELDGANGIRLRVPDAWLDSARFPVRVDPTFTTHTVASTPTVEHAPDVCFDRTTGRTTVVYESNFSGTDHDVGLAVLDSGTVLATEWVDFTSDHWVAPRVAHVTSRLRSLVVATRGPAAGPTQIWARMVTTDGTLENAQFRVDVGVGTSSDQPDVGGDNSYDQSRNLCVVWRRSLGSAGANAIAVAQVTSSGALSGTWADVPTPIGDNGHPRISDTHDGSNWTVVFDRNEAGQHDVWGSRPSISSSSSPTGAFATTSSDERLPTVSSCLNGTSRYLVTYQRGPAGGGDHDVLGQLMNGNSGESLYNISAGDGTVGDDTTDPVVETDGRHFSIAFRTGTSLRVTEMWATQSPVGVGLASAPVTLSSFTEPAANEAGIGSLWSTGSDGQRRMACVYTELGDVKLALLQNAVGGRAFAACFGDGTGAACPCGNSGGAGRGCANSANPAGARLSFSGNPGLGAEDTLTLIGTGMPPNVAGLYFQGSGLLASGAVFGDGLRCATGSVVRLGTKLNDVTGASQYPGAGDPSVSVRGGIAAGGGSAGYQLWYRNAASFCSISTFNLSNGLYVQFAP